MGNRARKWLKRIGVLLLALLALAGFALLWAFAIEPSLLTVTNITITDARLPEAMDGTRVVFFSDLHVGSYYSEAEAERAARKIASLKPDLLLFGGDLTQFEQPGHEPDGKKVAAAFAAITPRYGKYAVYGNHDIETPTVKALATQILKDGGFTLLQNESVKAAEGFYVSGTKSWPNHNAQEAWSGDDGSFTVLLAHEPMQIDQSSRFPFALQLSGHSHGGQIKLPFLWRRYMTWAVGPYVAGRFDVNGVPLYVTRGVGMMNMHARFLAPPEIVVITLHGK